MMDDDWLITMTVKDIEILREERYHEGYEDGRLETLEKLMKEMAGTTLENPGKREPGERQAREIYSRPDGKNG
jgi:hypothetical protein